jgi:tetratricopeptide (TPR) repeat protein
LLSNDLGLMGRIEDATREANLAMSLRPNDALVLYNIACTFCGLSKKDDAMNALRKAWESGFRDSDWARRDPDLAMLYDEPEFQRMYPQ